MRRSAAAAAVAALAMVSVACERASSDEWDAAAVREVVRRVDASSGEQRVVVLDGGAGGERALPWSVRQALATAGYEVVEGRPPAAAETRLVVLEASGRDGADWLVDTTLQGTPPPGIRGSASGAEAIRIRWRVRCNGSCAVVDSAVVPGGGAGS